MMFYNEYLSPEEYQKLYCSKEGWQRGEKRYDEFITLLKRHIEYYQSNTQIDLTSISFPEITFDQELLGTASVFTSGSEFYGDVVFENLMFKDKVYISGCSFLGKCCFENTVFRQNATIMFNTFKQETILKELTFKEEASFTDNAFHDALLLDTLTFYKEASFTDSILHQKSVIKNINGIEWFEWDDLYCMNYEQCEWSELDKYIVQKEPKKVRLIKLVHEIKKEFPEVIDEIKEELYQTGMGWSCYFWIEKFGYLTRDILRKREYTRAQKYLNFMDKTLKNADPDMTNTIEVGYVENILYDLTHKQKKEAWKYLPDRTKKSYAMIWGIPS